MTLVEKILDKIIASDVIVTAAGSGCSQFGSDNMEHFKPWMLIQLAKLESGSLQRLVLMVREFQKTKDAVTGFPCKKVCGCFLEKGQAVCVLSAAMVAQASGYDYETGDPLTPEPGVTFVDFETWLDTPSLELIN